MTAILFSFLLRSTILGALGLALLWILKKKSASVQHAMAVGTMAAMIALPLLSYLLPTRTVQVSRLPAVLSYLSATRLSDSPAVSPSAKIAQSVSLGWPALLAGVWLVVAAMLLIRLAGGFAILRSRISSCKELQFKRTVRVVEDGRATMPMVVWMGRTRILLPPSWSSWSRERLDQVLAHEEAHVLRGDWFSQVFAQLAKAVMWPNPFAHVLARRVGVLAEQAADDLVLSAGADPAGYASALLDVARGAATTPAFAVPMAAKADVAKRIEMILNSKKQRGAVTLRTLVVSGLALAAISGPVACWALKPGHSSPSQTPRSAMFGAPTPLMILNQKDVQRDLGLGGEQSQRIDEIMERFKQQTGLVRKNGAKGATMGVVTSTLLTQLDSVLTDRERARLNEIFIQWRKNDAILDSNVQVSLGLSPAQKSRIKQAANRFQLANKDLYQRLNAGGITPSALQSEQQAINTAYEDDMARVLTDSQASRLSALGGTPFTGAIRGTIWTVGN